MRIELGMDVVGTDGAWGTVRDVIVDPTRRAVSHVVVAPRGHDGARLLPIEAIGQEGDHLTVAWSSDELAQLRDVDETEYIRRDGSPEIGEAWDVHFSSYLVEPYYPYLAAVAGAHGGPPATADAGLGAVVEDVPNVPTGRSDIRRGSEVWSSDDHVVGKVEAFLVDDDRRVTHVVLEHGHLWGHREITVPMSAVAQVHSDWIELSITKDEVENLPPVTFR
jgi:sporulation protein YlmC with PRC-barrel domain